MKARGQSQPSPLAQPARQPIDLTPLATVIVVVASLAYLLFSRTRRRTTRISNYKGPPRLSAIFCFPVKSMRGVSLTVAKLDGSGIAHDRRWVVLQEKAASGQDFSVVTAREFPSLTTIQPSLSSMEDEDPTLTLTLPTGDKMVVNRDSAGQRRELRAALFRETNIIAGEDQGDDVAEFLTSFLGASPPVRLARMDDRTMLRPLRGDVKYAPAVPAGSEDFETARYSDWSPLSVVSSESLDFLNRSLSESMGEQRNISHTQFRTNLIVDLGSGYSEFGEDRWGKFLINGVPFEHLKRCGRCVLSTIDPATGKKDARLEPLLFLMQERNGHYPWMTPESAFYSKEGFFAVNIRHLARGTLSVGDEVRVTEVR